MHWHVDGGLCMLASEGENIERFVQIPNRYPPSLEEDDNIIAVLKQSDRVNSISLTIISSLLEKLSAISEPLSELEELVLQSQGDAHGTLPSTFLWGPRLRTLHLTRIAIPSLLSLLSPCQDLVDLHLHEIPSSGYFSPEAFADALSGTPQLRSLTLHLLSFPRRQSHLVLPPPPGERVALPALTCLNYRGTSKYLDSFVARLDAPRLGEIKIRFFYQPTMDASQLGQFIERTEIHTSLIQADVKTSADAISISITDSSASTPLRLQISCKQLDWQLSCMAQVCDRVSPFLFHVSKVGISTFQSPDEKNGVGGEQWLDLLRSFKFGAAKSFGVNGQLTADILYTLCPANEGNTTMLPSLRQVHLKEPMAMDGPSWNSVQSFITARSISGHPVEIKAPSYQCHICHDSFVDRQEFKRHFRDNHAHQILCSYCDDFEFTPGHFDLALFREHLGSKHPEIARKDPIISMPSLTISQFDSLIHRHSSLRAPVIIRSSPTSTAPH